MASKIKFLDSSLRKERFIIFTILVVDDERAEREAVHFLLEKFQFALHMLEAENGEHALEMMAAEHIDILFTDIKMPFMDGLELARAARQLKPELKIVIFSAYDQFEYAKQAIHVNVLSYVLKPLDVEEFRRVMEDVIRICREEEQEKKEKQMLLEGYRKGLIYQQEKVLSTISEIEMWNDASEGDGDSHKKAIKEVLRFIDEQYMNEISLEMVSKAVYLSPNYVGFLFKKETGQSFVKYVTMYRLEKAKHLLIDTNMKISDISKAVGFTNHSYFGMTFKTYYGVTPVTYRNREDQG